MEKWQGEIKDLRIPDDDAMNWMQTLREGGFSDAEIESIMINLNTTYFRAKRETLINEILKTSIQRLEAESGTKFTEEKIKTMREFIDSKLIK